MKQEDLLMTPVSLMMIMSSFCCVSHQVRFIAQFILTLPILFLMFTNCFQEGLKSFFISDDG